MLRYVLPALALGLALPMAQAASLKEMELTRTLEKVAQESSVGTPRAINEDILDQGYTAEGNVLINHLSVQSSHAQKMRSDPKTVYFQLGSSVCNNPGFRKLMAKGAVMRYEITENKTNRPVASVKFVEADCPAPAAAKKKK